MLKILIRTKCSERHLKQATSNNSEEGEQALRLSSNIENSRSFKEQRVCRCALWVTNMEQQRMLRKVHFYTV